MHNMTSWTPDGPAIARLRAEDKSPLARVWVEVATAEDFGQDFVQGVTMCGGIDPTLFGESVDASWRVVSVPVPSKRWGRLAADQMTPDAFPEEVAAVQAFLDKILAQSGWAS